MRFTLLFALTYLLYIDSFAQYVGEDRQTNWNEVGNKTSSSENITPLSPDEIPVYDFVRDLGGDYTGKEDCSENLNESLRQLPKPAVVYFPPGMYLFTQTIEVPSEVSIKGASPFTTFFRFDLGLSGNVGNVKNLFQVRGTNLQKQWYSEVTHAPKKGEDFVIVKDASLYQKGDEVELDQENDARMFYYLSHNTDWARRSVGQMLVVKKVTGNKVYFDRTLTIDYNPKLDLRLTKVLLTKNVSFEAFTVERLDILQGSNFFLSYTANVSISCVRSLMATREHVRINYSRNCEVKGSNFYDAHFHCGGGAGYGILLSKHPTDCLISNNIFGRLRHSLVVKEGANRNVISYNYSYDPVISDGVIANGECYNPRVVSFPDISVHGHYSFMNLFEQNIVQGVHSADNWGPSGPGTTFFRNKIISKYGLRISQSSEKQNVIGNIVYNKIQIDTGVTDVYRYKNLEIYGRNKPAQSLPLSASLYLTEKPEFYGNMPWPSIDPNHPSQASNPAYHRWKNGKIFDKNCCGNIPGIESNITFQNNLFVFYDNGTIYVQQIKNESFQLVVYDVQGKTVATTSNFTTDQPFQLGRFLSSGMYLLSLRNDSNNYLVKFIVRS